MGCVQGGWETSNNRVGYIQGGPGACLGPWLGLEHVWDMRDTSAGWRRVELAEVREKGAGARLCIGLQRHWGSGRVRKGGQTWDGARRVVSLGVRHVTVGWLGGAGICLEGLGGTGYVWCGMAGKGAVSRECRGARRKGGLTCGGTGARRGVACHVGHHRGVWARTRVGCWFGVQRASVCRNAVGVHERGAVVHGCVGKAAQRVGATRTCQSGVQDALGNVGLAWGHARHVYGHVLHCWGCSGGLLGVIDALGTSL